MLRDLPTRWRRADSIFWAEDTVVFVIRFFHNFQNFITFALISQPDKEVTLIRVAGKMYQRLSYQLAWFSV